MSFSFRWKGLARQSGNSCSCGCVTGPTADPHCSLCQATAPTTYFFSASGAVCNCDLPAGGICTNGCECIDSLGAYYDLCSRVNGSFSWTQTLGAGCPNAGVGPADKACWVVAGNQDATIGWNLHLTSVAGGKAQWKATLNYSVPGNPSAASIFWTSPIFDAPMDCSQTITSWTVNSSSLAAYDATTTNGLGQTVWIYNFNHCDFTSMSLSLHT